ncbi:putative toxin-antitoxin system toxin component, PIN family [Spectribacter hydrogenoxidans]|uniref:Toxin-antitoxin system toxin component, PIN family n=1 Tax=Spectribacter hydrogenoxidans TaxID=3075608 RepID=A0ABU3BY86_9GAMM|nr:putative toxin-antitoxin system toxin component, PIN family [Salinisphaera sp. W335]MDT0634275.1 putative toxin-antitoxin system toxin component, PIN family [Salinisphaera sp. W335]
MSGAVVVDTNVVIAGLLTGETTSPVARILDSMLGAAFPFVLSEPLLAEYRAVILRPRLRDIHGLGDPDIDDLLVTLTEHAIVISPQPTVLAPDSGDQHLWELLAARADLRLVTGDKRLFEAGIYRQRIISPQAFVGNPQR